MKKIIPIFIILLVVLSLLVTYYIINFEKFSSKDNDLSLTANPSVSVDLVSCQKVDEEDYRGQIERVNLMRKYLAEKENIPLTTGFTGKIIDGTQCFSLKVSNLEVYEDNEGNLVIVKDGVLDNKVPERSWKY